MMKKILCLVCLALCLAHPSGAKAVSSHADTIRQALPSVVHISTQQNIRKELLSLYEYYFQSRIPQGLKHISLGSGVIISHDGYIVTNYHIIQEVTQLDIWFPQQKIRVAASIVGVDAKSDLALLKIQANKGLKLSPLDFGNSDLLHLGDSVLTLGSPFGLAPLVSSGILSAKGAVLALGRYEPFMQVDTPIHPGNSGGALIDFRGRLIGINSAMASKVMRSGTVIPSNLVKSLILDLKRHGKVIRPWLGIVGRDVLESGDIEFMQAASLDGVITQNLMIDSPASRAGLKIGDLITELGNEKIKNLRHLQQVLLQKKIGSQQTLKVHRPGKGTTSMTLIVEEMPKNQDLPLEDELF